MNAVSVCDGISAASVACEGLGYNFMLLSEIEAFPRSVLQQRHHAVDQRVYTTKDSIEGKSILWGDFTTIRPRHIRRSHGHADIDVLFGGTPCQSYSVAGKRAGLDDPRGELSLEYTLLAYRLGVRWFLWENVPGVFSSAGGEDFAAILSAFTGRMVEVPAGGWQNSGVIPEAGPGRFGVAWRVLDAQYAGVPQRRRRVFVVGHLGDWRRAAAVLFDAYSLQGHPSPRRETGKDVAPTISARPSGGGGLGTDFDLDGGLNQSAPPLTGNPYGDNASREGLLVAHSLRGEGFDASEDGTGRGTPIVPVMGGQTYSSTGHIAHCLNAGGMGRQDFETETLLAVGGFPNPIAFDSKASGRNGFGVGDISPTLRAMGHKDSHSNAGGQVAVAAFNLRGREGGAMPEDAGDLASLRAADGGSSRAYVAPGMAVRRLTPRECERLQGFPDDYTLVDHRGKPAADGPRYKALGNSWAVPCVRWIAERMQEVDRITA
ncbi:DNA cytosine methyltransferase [Terriglobus sp. ADX1]|uniref:DNA cytosine methyltransferase n=1 Tax=Terriglobus sp. ADX1 TaxID=2794063 RepID=UPI002FE5C2B1